MKEFEHYFKELVDGKRDRLRDRLLLSALKIVSVPYGLAMRLRAILYSAGLLRSYRLPKPVLSVGNLTMGGTGKTPAVSFIARYYLERGKRVAVLSRGYGGSSEGATRIVADGTEIFLTPEEAGDEPYLLASTIPGLIVVIGANRYESGKLAMEKFNPDIFILDDGFQHLCLKRDLDILLLDCNRPFGNGRIFPAGFLREPASAIRRADLVVYTRCRDDLPTNIVGKPVCKSTHHLAGLVPVEGGQLQPFESATGGRAMAFAGIADPAAFFDSLEKAGVRLITTLAFSDHAGYGEEEIAAICRLKAASRSDYLITTEKDAVKLMPYLQQLGNVFAARVELRFDDDGPLRNMLEKFL